MVQADVVPMHQKVAIPWEAPAGCPEELKYHWTGYPRTQEDPSGDGEGEA